MPHTPADRYRPGAPALTIRPRPKRTGGPRGDPPDRRLAPPVVRRRVARRRAGTPLRTHLAADHGLPDGGRRVRAHDGRHRCRATRPRRLGSARRGRWSGSTAFSPSTKRAATTCPPRAAPRARTTMTAACRRWPRTTRSASTASPSSSTSPNSPPRYTEATLIKRMEELVHVGRPPIRDLFGASRPGLRPAREKQLIPEDKGRLVTVFLESFFERYVEYDFTADLEEKLDKISNGDISSKENASSGGSSPPTSPRPTTSASPRSSRR